jgi:glycogen debranching enzyme
MREDASTLIASEPDPHFVHPRSDLLDDRTRVLKHGDLFAVFDRRGDALAFQTSSHGLYYRGTRFLSGLVLKLDGQRPLLLASTVRDDNALMTVDMANAAREEDGVVIVPGDTVHVFRSRFLCGNTCYERVRVTNHGTEPVEARLSIRLLADFADVFEVRGAKRDRRGTTLEPEVSASRLELGYRGLDGEPRTTVITCDPEPAEITRSEIRYGFRLDTKQEAETYLTISCHVAGGPTASGRSGDGDRPRHDDAFKAACSELEEARGLGCRVRTSNELFNRWIGRSLADLHMMLTRTEHGLYPYAGVPWFNTVFGRDGIITARETLWLNPAIACGVIRHLAATQAERGSAARDADPGKIVHETREGEMAALGEVPFARYYGSVDATPLFVMLAHDYYARTGDVATVRDVWPAVKKALAWIDRFGDLDGDGFVEYARHTPHGLLQQGWKDSGDSVFHASGHLAQGPIALCEVQAYAYAAREGGARLATLLDEPELAATLLRQAAELRERFGERFWREELGTYALALDGAKALCEVRTSNAGHCLFAGIAEPEHARRVTATLMDETSFSGWGIRTLDARERRYNPMSYHNGSVWPHDNAIVAAGMARYGAREPTLRVMDALFHASLFLELHRMPELFCGFKRRSAGGPTLYPVACAPQSWAAAAVFLMLEACLGLRVDGEGGRVVFQRPTMPNDLDWIEILGLTVGGASVDLLLRRARSDVAIEVLDKRGDAAVVITKTI